MARREFHSFLRDVAFIAEKCGIQNPRLIIAGQRIDEDVRTFAWASEVDVITDSEEMERHDFPLRD